MNTRPLFIETSGVDGGDQPAFDPLRQDGQIVDATGNGHALASTRRNNPLDANHAPAAFPAGVTVLWSGSLGEDLFATHPHTWMSPGQTAFREWCEAALTSLDDDARLVLQPHACHVLSDVQTTFDFARQHADSPLGVAISPATMLTHSMLGQIEEHLVRYFETLGSICSMVFLHDVIAVGESISPAPLGMGQLPRPIVHELLDACVPRSTPIVLWPGGVEAQSAWLDGA